MEYRPRIRLSRKKPVTRKGCYVVAVCETEPEAKAIEAFMAELFRKAAEEQAAAKKADVENQYAAAVLGASHPNLKEIQNGNS